ncbi:MAG: hypothetical protein WCK42_03770 [Myxococcaceae bacterium]
MKNVSILLVFIFSLQAFCVSIALKKVGNIGHVLMCDVISFEQLQDFIRENFGIQAEHQLIIYRGNFITNNNFDTIVNGATVFVSERISVNLRAALNKMKTRSMFDNI